MLSMQRRKNITVEDNKKIMNKANFINLYLQIYIPILYVTRIPQNKYCSMVVLLTKVVV